LVPESRKCLIRKQFKPPSLVSTDSYALCQDALNCPRFRTGIVRRSPFAGHHP
jgi:hypothetical protein